MARLNINRKSGFIQRSGVMRRETVWIGSAVVQTSLAAASTAVQVFVFAAAVLALRPFTIVRSRGSIFVTSDQQASTERWQVALGASVVTEQANGIGVTAVPTPATDNDSDAFYILETVFGEFVQASGVGIDAHAGRLHRFDSKAMRKVEDGFDNSIVVETFSTSSGVNIDLQLRQLAKLH